MPFSALDEVTAVDLPFETIEELQSFLVLFKTVDYSLENVEQVFLSDKNIGRLLFFTKGIVTNLFFLRVTYSFGGVKVFSMDGCSVFTNYRGGKKLFIVLQRGKLFLAFGLNSSSEDEVYSLS